MKTVFVVIHSFEDFDYNNQTEIVGVWTDQSKAKEFCDEMDRLMTLCANFTDSVNKTSIKSLEFSKPKPIRDDSLLIKMKEFETIDPKSKETKLARKNWMKYADLFQRTYDLWSKEKFAFDKKRIENEKIAKRNLFIEIMTASKELFSPEQSTKIVEIYDLGFCHYAEGSVYEVKETVCYV